MKSAIVAMVLSLCLIALIPVSSFATDYQKKPRPQWVTHHKVDTTTPIPTNLISDGVFYRLVDDQIKVEERIKFKALRTLKFVGKYLAVCLTFIG